MEDLMQWGLFLKGDKNALAFIFRTFHKDLFCYGLKLCGNKEIVNDCIQDMFLKLWKNRQSISSIKIIKPYLFKVLRRHIQSTLEIQSKYGQYDTNDEPFHMEYSAEDFLIQKEVEEEIRKKVLDVLNQLSVRQREAIYLRFFEELDFDTIAQIMDMNLQSVRNTLHRGMQTMRELLVLNGFLLLLGKSSLIPGVS